MKGSNGAKEFISLEDITPRALNCFGGHGVHLFERRYSSMERMEYIVMLQDCGPVSIDSIPLEVGKLEG